MIEIKKLESSDIKKEIDPQNVKNLKNISDKYKNLRNDIFFSLYFKKIMQFYKKEYYLNPSNKIDYKKLQKLFYKIEKTASKKDIEIAYFPSIDFQNDKKYIQEIKEISKKYLDKHNERVATLYAIQEFLNKHIKYPFFLAFQLDKKNWYGLPKSIWITKEDKNFLIYNITTDSKIDQQDKFLQNFLNILKNWENKDIRLFLIKDFNKIEENNQKILLKWFWNQRKDENWNYLYSYLSDSKIEDIVDKYWIWDCTHISLMWKHFFNKIYDGKEVKMLYLANPMIAHAYNVLLFKTSERIEFIYIDFLWDRKQVFEEHIKHKFDILVK